MMMDPMHSWSSLSLTTNEMGRDTTSMCATDAGSGAPELLRGVLDGPTPEGASFDVYCVFAQAQQCSWTRETRSCPIEGT